MRAKLAAATFALLFGVTAMSCGPSARNSGDDCAGICSALGYQACAGDGSFEPPVACNPDETCDPVAGCVVCVPDTLYCGGPTSNDILRCNGEGTGGDFVASCAQGEVCSNGDCKTPCEAAEDHPSNLGCDFWAADLDNESFNSGLGLSNDAAAQQYSLVVANNNDFPVNVTVLKNAARVGQPVNEQVVFSTQVATRGTRRIDLPQREVDGAQGQNGGYTANSGSGTFVSPHAYHVLTTGPVVVYQFNPIVQQFSNDASTLIPIQALGTDYIAMGFETANPCAIEGLSQPSIPDHGSIAIIAPFDNTTVTVTASHPMMASAGDSGFPLAATPRDGTLTFTTGRYTVVNLETQQPTGGISECINGGADGDVTGTYIKADRPIVVFTANERGIGFGGADNVEYPPDWTSEDDICCTEHLEEQLFPLTAHGKEFAVARSPIRSTDPSGWVEPDIIRVVGSVDGTMVTTNLPAPYNSFTVNARQKVTFAAKTGFTLSATAAIQIGSYQVSQQFVKHGQTGDPSMLTIPAAEQHRKDYVFLVPDTFEKNFAVFAKPVGSNIFLDGISLSSVELGQCVLAPLGPVLGVAYEQFTCPLTEGHHAASSDKPFGLSVYGRYNVGAYSFVGGSDVKLINPLE